MKSGLGSTGIIRSFMVSGTQAASALTIFVLPSFPHSLMVPDGSLSSSSHILTPGSKKEEGQKGRRGFCRLSTVPFNRLPKRHKTISFYLSLTRQSHVAFWLYLLPKNLKSTVLYFCHGVRS